MTISVNCLTSIINTINKPACVVDGQGNVIAENQALTVSIAHDDTIARVKRAVRSGAQVDDELLLSKTTDGEEHWMVIAPSHITNSHLQALETAARTDGLTGLYNKISFMEILAKKFESSTGNGTHLCLMIVDLDGFKSVNDTHGHQAGDAALVSFAQHLKEVTRSNDICARIGGDEFAIILDAPFEVAVSVSERLEKRYVVPFEGKLLEHGCSVGIAVHRPEYGYTLESLLSSADATMYDRKYHKKKHNNPAAHNRYARLVRPDLSKLIKIKMPFPLPLEFVLENTIDNIADTEIRTSELHGFGLFATQAMPANQVICTLTGQIMSKDTYHDIVERLSPMLEDLSFYFCMECNHIERPGLLMVRSFRTKWSYVNHSVTPNCRFDVFTQKLVTLRQIDLDEELTFDYRSEPLDDVYIQTNKFWLEQSY